ncbi:hypothetical protein [Paucisalibacillus sp. EB02]|uniref:hypothetical protein n=1 Tax=Paucisalibacillus sp. EB02 TaxID=1347087 RepID=UPI0004B9552C|nr:hypothetical protein [Paucisalibacillus sp. EB02]
MSPILFLLLTICALQIIGVILINIVYRKHLQPMHGMLLSMSLGMMTGLLFGTILGLQLNGDLFTSTVISMLIGLSIGFIAGLPFNLIAIIEGSVSGIMGGMMGAMLGEMIPLSNPDAMIKLLVFFTIMILLLVSYLTETSINIEMKIPILVSSHPFLYIVVITIIFVLLKDVSIITIENQNDHHSF